METPFFMSSTRWSVYPSLPSFSSNFSCSTSSFPRIFFFFLRILIYLAILLLRFNIADYKLYKNITYDNAIHRSISSSALGNRWPVCVVRIGIPCLAHVLGLASSSWPVSSACFRIFGISIAWAAVPRNASRCCWTDCLLRWIGLPCWEVGSSKSQSSWVVLARLSICWGRWMLNKRASTVIVGLFDVWSLCADPLRLALCFYVWLSGVFRLFVSLRKLACEFLELNIPFARRIEVVGQIFYLPVLKDSKFFDLLLELLTRNIPVFVIIKLFEEHSHFRVVLFGLYSLETV